MGAGSLGTIIGALTAKNGGDMVLIDAYQEHVDALNEKGATVIGKLELTGVPVKAITPQQMEGIYDVVILLAKQTYNDVALAQLLPHLGPDSVVCTLQNGVPEEAVAKIIGRERVVGGIVGWGASFRGPGVSELTSDVSAMRYEIGELDGRNTQRIQAVAGLLSLSGACAVMDNLMGTRWSKVIQNATLSGMSAALGCTYAQILDDDKAVSCAAWVGNEIVQLVRRRGIQLEDLVPGWSYYSLAFDDEAGLAAQPVAAGLLQASPPAEGQYAPGHGEGPPLRDRPHRGHLQRLGPPPGRGHPSLRHHHPNRQGLRARGHPPAHLRLSGPLRAPGAFVNGGNRHDTYHCGHRRGHHGPRHRHRVRPARLPGPPVRVL